MEFMAQVGDYLLIQQVLMECHYPECWKGSIENKA